MTRVASSPAHCRNCGAEATWNYCPQCGQETKLALPPAFAFLRDAAGRYVRLDGRMWRSLHALLFRPGFLTREHLAGRRRRYVQPARMFVALSIVLFAVLRFSAGTPTIAEVRISRGAATVEKLPRDEPARAAAPGEADEEMKGPGFRVDHDLNVSLDDSQAPWLAPLRKRFDALNRLSRQEKADQIVAGMFRYAPYAAIGLLPLFALLLKVAYAGSRRRHPSRPRLYAAHLLFGAHTHAFLFAVMIALALVPFGFVRGLLLLWATIYAVASLKAVYGGSWTGAVLRAAAMAFCYSILFGIAVAALVVAAIVLR